MVAVTWPTFEYDALNRRVSETDPLGHQAFWLYDAAGNLAGTVDRDGRRIAYTYDDANRVTVEQWFDAQDNLTDQITLTYDDNGRVLTASNSAGTVSYRYDAAGRVASETGASGLTFTYRYDDAGQVTQVVDSQGGMLRSTYDDAGNLASRSLSGPSLAPLLIVFGYDDANRLTAASRYSNLLASHLVGSSTWAYDASGLLTHAIHRDGSGGVLSNYAYDYNADGLITQSIEDGVTINYSYDNNNQLTAAGSSSYSYDPAGNRNGPNDNVGTGNLLLSDGTWNYSYDNENNLVKKVRVSDGLTSTYDYDDHNHLIHAEKRQTDGGTLLASESYHYDAFGTRVEKDTTSGSTTTVQHYAWLGGNLYADQDSSGSVDMRYVTGVQADQLLAREDDDFHVRWFLTDHLGSVRVVTDNFAGNAVDRITYDAYGNITNETNAAAGGRIKFTGRELDATTELQFNRDRYYDSLTGRWTSEDREGFGAGDLNLQRYVGNDPVNATDPSGKEIYFPYGRKGSQNFKVTEQALNAMRAALTGLVSTVGTRSQIHNVQYGLYDTQYKEDPDYAQGGFRAFFNKVFEIAGADTGFYSARGQFWMFRNTHKFNQNDVLDKAVQFMEDIGSRDANGFRELVDGGLNRQKIFLTPASPFPSLNIWLSKAKPKTWFDDVIESGQELIDDAKEFGKGLGELWDLLKEVIGDNWKPVAKAIVKSPFGFAGNLDHASLV
jgi:RHS repeat-associated protein